MFVVVPNWAAAALISSHVMSISVNAMATGLIAFRIYKVFKQVKANSVSNLALNDAPGSALGNVLFMIIESGVILFSIQLIRLVMYSVQTLASTGFHLIIPFHVILNVIIRSVISTILILLIMRIWPGHNTYTHYGAGLNEYVFQRQRFRGSYGELALYGRFTIIFGYTSG